MTPADEADEMADALVLDRLLAGVNYVEITEVGAVVRHEHGCRAVLRNDDESLGQAFLRALAVARGER